MRLALNARSREIEIVCVLLLLLTWGSSSSWVKAKLRGGVTLEGCTALDGGRRRRGKSLTRSNRAYVCVCANGGMGETPRNAREIDVKIYSFKHAYM